MPYSLKFLPVFALVAAMFSFSAGTPFGPDAAWAQTATKLDCRKCVKSKAIKKGAVKFNRLQGKVQDRITALESAAAQRQPFYILLDGDGSEQTVATNGALEMFARCTVNDVGTDRIEIFAVSTLDGWFLEDNNTPQSAGVETLIFSASIGTTNTAYQDNIDETSMVAPDGSYIGIDGETIGLGLNLFGHNCLAVGTASLITGTP